MIIHIDIHSHMRLAGYLLCGHSGSPWRHCWDPQWWAGGAGGDPGIRLACFGNLLARFGHVLACFWGQTVVGLLNYISGLFNCYYIKIVPPISTFLYLGKIIFSNLFSSFFRCVGFYQEVYYHMIKI